jgi:ribokinase
MKVEQPSEFSEIPSENNKTIIVIGSVGFDYNIITDEIPGIGETKLVDIERGLGGKGNNQAIACARAGEDTIFLGAVADKDYDNLLTHFEENNVTAILKRDRLIPSHTACILIDKDKNHRIFADPRASFTVNKNLIKLNKEYIDKSSYILLQLEIDFEAVEYVIEQYKNKKTIILNPSPISQLERLKLLIKNIDYLILNEAELGIISGEETKTTEQIEAACNKIDKILKLEPKNIIVPLLDKGWLLWNKKGKKKFDSYSVGEAIDKVGSMDCFIGVFAAFLCKNSGVEEAIKHAILASNISSTKEGIIPSLPLLSEIIRKKNKIKNW